MEIQDNSVIENTNQYEGYIAVGFPMSPRSYFFGTDDKELKPGDKVVVETARGLELGTITSEFKSMEEYHSSLGLKPILRRASIGDIRMSESNKKDAVFAMEICKKEVEIQNLNMHLISCEYTLDKAKVIFSYLADERVDFRELLKILAPKLHTRIELRQINSRDKAKMVGGVGMCGLKLCCATFLNEFDGISINRAKNQMLAINVPKLSGHCGKLLCCLKYEDDFYSEAKQNFPDIGTKLFIDKKEWKVNGFNIISEEIRLEGDGDIMTISLSDFKKQTNPNQKKEEFVKSFNNENISQGQVKEANLPSTNEENQNNKERKNNNKHFHHRNNKKFHNNKNNKNEEK